MQHNDLIIIGGGIVGLATAYRFLERFPGKRVTVLEKERRSRGIKPAATPACCIRASTIGPARCKAQNCRAGKLAMEEFCRREGIPFQICGKVIVAVEESELPRMEKILENGKANGVVCERIEPSGCASSSRTRPASRRSTCPRPASSTTRRSPGGWPRSSKRQGSKIVTGAASHRHSPRHKRAIVETTAGEFAAEQVVNCAGLYSDRVTRLSGAQPSSMIVPFRGEFYLVKPEAHHLVRMLIYPVPDPNYPFLGVHFTRRIDGRVECGPNAVLAFAREGYRNTT